ncbi:vitamin K epoxide reductase family protein [Bradyrhizobium zhanjiangense]|uniref:Vitamin K epoxide reductase family protein n=1 Tax=Bradyrhizobium zhanjiangense TaxID=1325107 RepID=A0ABY0DG37_9BRAD|nr:vitamin K epoxide reductase family protein [Bradyrhizobium zhanjiangense]RXG90396.1 vitamin K epoxide reductase family protein [Bradyrhizobium zhanjiangense]
MNIYRLIAFGVAAVSAAAMIYVGLYQSRLVGRLLCPIFGDGCEGVADAPFARPFGIPDGYIGAVLYAVVLGLLLAPPVRWVWIALFVLSTAATFANILGVRDMMNFGSYCFYCLTTTVLSPVLLWSVWQLR